MPQIDQSRASGESGDRAGSVVPAMKDCVPAENLLSRYYQALNPDLGPSCRTTRSKVSIPFTLHVVALIASFSYSGTEAPEPRVRDRRKHLRPSSFIFPSSFPVKPSYTPWRPFRSYILHPAAPINIWIPRRVPTDPCCNSTLDQRST